MSWSTAEMVTHPKASELGWAHPGNHRMSSKGSAQEMGVSAPRLPQLCSFRAQNEGGWRWEHPKRKFWRKLGRGAAILLLQTEGMS